MPTDLSPHVRLGVIQVMDREGVGLPFSKGLMATSILATGVETDVAYGIAAEVERKLREQGQNRIDADDLVQLATNTITRRVGSEIAERYVAWRQVKRSGRPVFIALGGAPGIGKSTIATRLAVRLGFARIVTTDTIREVLRTVIPNAVLPELHVSTHESPAFPETDGSPMQSFQRQARAVSAATGAVARRLAAEGRSAIFEGVHLLPGYLSSELRQEKGPVVVEMLLTLADGSLHEAHLTCRLHGEPARGGKRHLNNFSTIRTLQEELRKIARQSNVVEYDVADPEDLTQRVVDEIMTHVRLPESAANTA